MTDDRMLVLEYETIAPMPDKEPPAAKADPNKGDSASEPQRASKWKPVIGRGTSLFLSIATRLPIFTSEGKEHKWRSIFASLAIVVLAVGLPLCAAGYGVYAAGSWMIDELRAHQEEALKERVARQVQEEIRKGKLPSQPTRLSRPEREFGHPLAGRYGEAGFIKRLYISSTLEDNRMVCDGKMKAYVITPPSERISGTIYLVQCYGNQREYYYKDFPDGGVGVAYK